MSFLKELVDGVASGVLSAVSHRLTFTSASKLVEVCCQQLGWAIDESAGTGGMVLPLTTRLLMSA